jgi:hypothetical protein
VAIYMPRQPRVSLAAVFAAMERDAKKKPKAETTEPAVATKARKRETKPQLAHPKDEPWRSEPYRRLVALRPCENCGRQGRSQAAHIPPDGKATKQDDRETFALCTVTGNKPGCHEKFDQYKLGDRAWAMKTGKAWAAGTRAELLASGQLPPKIAKAVADYKPPRKTK